MLAKSKGVIVVSQGSPPAHTSRGICQSDLYGCFALYSCHVLL